MGTREITCTVYTLNLASETGRFSFPNREIDETKKKKSLYLIGSYEIPNRVSDVLFEV